MGNCQATEVPSAEEVVVTTPPKSKDDQEETSTRSPAPSMEVDSTPPPAPEVVAAVPEVDAAAGDATASAPAEADAPAEPAAEAEVKPVVHETRFGVLLEKFNACKIRDASGTITDIDMAKFFEACDLYRDMLSKLGSAAGMVLNDITSNLKKAQVVYEEAPADRATFSGYLKGGSVVGCTWLLRGVDFFLTMVYLMFTSNTGSPGVEAYKQTLMQYHGWAGEAEISVAEFRSFHRIGETGTNFWDLMFLEGRRKEELCIKASQTRVPRWVKHCVSLELPCFAAWENAPPPYAGG
ncbi:plekha8 [Symbiodinium sp. CCMP2592]|nr:plekha8 [Symbiodinium sp. CCMP2592]